MTRCGSLALYTVPEDRSPELLSVVPSDQLVTCLLEEGHDGDHEFPPDPRNE